MVLDATMSLIIDHLYLAGISEVMREVETNELEITHIVNVAEEIQSDRSDMYAYLHLGVIDDDPEGNIINILETCIDWIHESILEGGNVIVHCWSGVSRSTCIVIAYLVKYHNMTVIDAYHKVLANRSIIDPWPIYLKQVEKWAENYTL